MRSFRGLRYFLAPPWLTGRGDGEKIAFTLEWLLDAFLEKVRQGLEARFPSRAGASALNLIIGDRGLLRGRNESTASIVSRLRAWRTPRTHRVRGNAYETLLQIWHYWGGVYVATIDSHGLRHEIGAADSADVGTLADPAIYASWVSAGNTQWDGAIADVQWSRFWVVLQPTAALAISVQPDLGDASLWGGALGTPGYTLGQTGATPADVAAMRALFQELKWRPIHAQPEWLVLGLDPLAAPDVVPNDTWLYWSKDSSGTRVASRVPTSAPSFTSGANAYRSGAGSMSPALPASGTNSALLLWHEARASGAFDAPPTGWTQFSEQTGPFGMRNRVCVRDTLGASNGSENGATVSYSPTGASHHVVKITAVSPPQEGWQLPGIVNVADAVNTTDGDVSIAMPANAVDTQHRLAFISFAHFDLARNVSGGGNYTERYDAPDFLNMSMYDTKVDTSGDTVSIASTGFADVAVVSLRLVYNRGWRFWSLAPEWNNTYAGDRGRTWSNRCTLPGGSTYAGNRANTGAFNGATVPQPPPILATYAGVRSSFPERVLLLDDGSIPK